MQPEDARIVSEFEKLARNIRTVPAAPLHEVDRITITIVLHPFQDIFNDLLPFNDLLFYIYEPMIQTQKMEPLVQLTYENVIGAHAVGLRLVGADHFKNSFFGRRRVSSHGQEVADSGHLEHPRDDGEQQRAQYLSNSPWGSTKQHQC